MELRLISSRLCPFAQRNVIVLNAKGVNAQVEFVDLFDKPPWLLELSAAGKVPLLVVDGEVLSESNVISEFVEEVVGEVPLHPPGPLGKAKARMFIEAVSPMNMEVHRLMMAPDLATATEAATTLRHRMESLDPLIAGPFFLGDRFSLVDAAAAPALVRLHRCLALAPELPPVTEGLPRALAWMEKLLAEEPVRRSVPAGFEELFREFLQGRGSPRRSVNASWLGSRAAPGGLL